MTKCSRSNQRELHKFVAAIYPRAPSTQFQRRPLDGSTRLPPHTKWMWWWIRHTEPIVMGHGDGGDEFQLNHWSIFVVELIWSPVARVSDVTWLRHGHNGTHMLPALLPGAFITVMIIFGRWTTMDHWQIQFSSYCDLGVNPIGQWFDYIFLAGVSPVSIGLQVIIFIFFSITFQHSTGPIFKNYVWPIVNYWTMNRLTINSKLKTQITRNGRPISGQRRRFEFNRLLTVP